MFASFIEARFASSGIRPEPGLGDAIVELAANVPYDVQRLAHETWDDVRVAGRRTVGARAICMPRSRGCSASSRWYSRKRGSASRSTQRAVLRALVLESGRELLSADVRTRHRLPVTSSVQSALSALVKQDIVQKEGGRYLLTIRSTANGWRARPSEAWALGPGT